MIRSDREYREAVSRLLDEEGRITAQRAELEQIGLAAEEVKRVIDPIVSFHLQLREEVESYERLKRREIAELRNLRGLGQLLTCLRIASGLTQRELAEKLGVHESQISRDERNEYHGITVDRAAKILDALGASITISATIDSAPSATSESELVA